MAAVHGRHSLAEPPPFVSSGATNGWRKIAWGKQKMGLQPQLADNGTC
jgi:hypothetical protein